jgi:hypothetical protein
MAKKAPRARRRSTRIYRLGALEDSVVRQTRWEKVVRTQFVDSYFTIQTTLDGSPVGEEVDLDEPLYISECVPESMVPP